MSECVLCHKIMGRGTKPRTVIDWDTLQILGQAHTGCVRTKSKYEDIRFYPEDLPRPDEIAFSKGLRDFMLAVNETWSRRKWPPHVFHQYLLASAALFRVSTSEQWANLARVKSLTEWWLNGSKIIPQREYDALFEWIASFDTHAEQSVEAEE
ncbi:hypothetical protein ES702_03293 [subsurface metagenome]